VVAGSVEHHRSDALVRRLTQKGILVIATHRSAQAGKGHPHAQRFELGKG